MNEYCADTCDGRGGHKSLYETLEADRMQLLRSGVGPWKHGASNVFGSFAPWVLSVVCR
jgi:hypothetical protein